MFLNPSVPLKAQNSSDYIHSQQHDAAKLSGGTIGGMAFLSIVLIASLLYLTSIGAKYNYFCSLRFVNLLELFLFEVSFSFHLLKFHIPQSPVSADSSHQNDLSDTSTNLSSKQNATSGPNSSFSIHLEKRALILQKDDFNYEAEYKEKLLEIENAMLVIPSVINHIKLTGSKSDIGIFGISFSTLYWTIFSVAVPFVVNIVVRKL